MTFCATANAILHAGAAPVFADVEPDTGNLDARRIEEKITKNTKAIVPVHLYGRMCDMQSIRKLADRHGLVVIEDAAHCIEGVRDNVRPGQLGDAACFSFYATKNITCGEGGAVVTRFPEKAELLQMLRLQGIDRSAADRYTKRYRHWDMPVLGWKFNMDNIAASLLIGQLDRIEAMWERRAQIAETYDRAFAGLPGLRVLPKAENGRNAFHLYTIRVPGEKRDRFLLSLQERGVGVAVNYRPVHLLKYYRERFGYVRGAFPLAEAIGDETISLPFYPRLNDGEVAHVVETVTDLARVIR
jgi:dTDP-4-amino-4,6-dideoxygalactose transaminase